jgi:hypothetical protein
MTLSRKFASMLAGCLLAAMLAGCEPGGAGKPVAQAATTTSAGTIDEQLNPCAEKLHDLCQQLLMYYLAHKELPPSLADLDSQGTSTHPAKNAWCCPISGKPYIYNPQGLPLLNLKGSMIVYDSLPCGRGRLGGSGNSLSQKTTPVRWGILMQPHRPGRPLVISVVSQPEAVFFQYDQREN